MRRIPSISLELIRYTFLNDLMRNHRFSIHRMGSLLLVGMVLSGCGKKDASPESSSGPMLESYSQYAVRTSNLSDNKDLESYRPIHVGAPVGDQPWIAHVRAIDLDQDGLMDVIFCESKTNEVMWLRQTSIGIFEELVIGTEMRAPVHVEAADMDNDGDLDVIVSSMSMVFPNNDRIGAIFILENQGTTEFIPHLVIDKIERVTDARAVDFDQDGLMDLAVGQFGYDQGSVSWLRRTGDWSFERKPLLELSGTVNVCVADFDQNGKQDMVALVSQQWEEIHLFLNVGHDDYYTRVIWGSTNEDYSISGMSVADINKDGYMDILFSNGDGFGPNPEPGPKPWHGVQYLENETGGRFSFKRIGDLGGAYAPVAADIDLDGDMDVVALATFNDWSKPDSVSLVWFRNDGRQNFERRTLAYRPHHLTTLDIADMDGSGGRPWLITGGFHSHPPFDKDQSRILLWKPKEN